MVYMYYCCMCISGLVYFNNNNNNLYINIKQTNYTYNRILLYDSGIILDRMAVALARTRWTLSRP